MKRVSKVLAVVLYSALILFIAFVLLDSFAFSALYEAVESGAITLVGQA